MWYKKTINGVFTLFKGNIWTQLIPVLFSPILTRIFSPSDFGIFAIYVSLVSILAIFATAKYESAIVLTKSTKEAISILSLILLIASIVLIFSVVLIMLNIESLSRIFSFNEASYILYFIPITVFLIACYQALNFYANKCEKYTSISFSMVLATLSSSFFNVIVGFLTSGGATVMIVSNILMRVVSITLLVKSKSKRLYLQIRSIKWHDILNSAKKYKEFPLYTLPQSFVYQGSTQMPVLFIANLFSTTILGYFNIAYRIITIPISIATNSLGRVYFQQASKMYAGNKQDLYKYTVQISLGLLILSCSVGYILYEYLPSIFAFVFGETWREAGYIAQYLLVYIVLAFAISPVSQLYFVAKRNNFYLKWELFRFLSIGFFFIIYYMFFPFDYNQLFYYFAFIQLVCYIIVSIPIIYKHSFLWKEV